MDTMMLLLIKEPQSCQNCPVCDGETGICKKAGIDISIDNRPQNCPLIEFPAERMYDCYNFESYPNGVNRGYNLLREEIIAHVKAKEKKEKDKE